MPGKKRAIKRDKMEALGKHVTVIRDHYKEQKYEFGERLGLDGSAVGEIEKGVRFVTAEVLIKMHPMLRAASVERVGVLLTWLEAQGLEQYVQDLHDWKAGKT